MTLRAPRRRPPRDQAESPFNVILEEFLDVVRFARGAAIVDFEGETVDYAGAVDPFELRVAAATFGLVLVDLRSCKNLKHCERIAALAGEEVTCGTRASCAPWGRHDEPADSSSPRKRGSRNAGIGVTEHRVRRICPASC